MKTQEDFLTVSSPNFCQKLITVQQQCHFPDVCIHYMNKLSLVKKMQKDKSIRVKSLNPQEYILFKKVLIVSNLYDNYTARGTTGN